MIRRHQLFQSMLSCLRRTIAGRALAPATALAVAIFITWPEAFPQATAQQGQPQGQQQPQTPPETPPQPATPEGQQPVFRTGINFVRVDVIVTDRNGAPVDDLQAADFELTEDGKPQVVESFKLVRITGTPEAGSEPAREIRSDSVEESEAARDDVRLFAIFLDDYHVRRGASMGVREPLMKFLQTQVGPLDMVALMYPLTPVADLRFTRNHDGMARAIESFLGRKFEYEPKNDFEMQYSNYPTEVVERVRNQVSLSALKGLATRMGGLREGRKAIVVVSEGYSYYVPPQLRSDNATMGAPIGRRNPMLGENNANEQRAAFFADSDMQLDLRLVYDAANRANTALYTLDPRGLAVFEYDINEAVGMKTDQQALQSTQDTLRVLAEQTDGRAIVNRNDLEGGLRQIIKDSSAYYLIGYNSSQAPTDGKFHEIKVRVKRQRVDVRARKGYWALTAEENARATAPPKPGPDPGVTNALAAVESPNRARVIRTWVGNARGENGKTRVTLVWEPAASTSSARQVPARVTVVAGGTQGAAYFRGRVPEGASDGGAGTGAAAANAARPTGGRVEFDAPPGPMQIRLSVESASGEVLDSDFQDVTVLDYAKPDVQISTPTLLRARTVPELRAMSADPKATPTAERQFRRTDRLIVRFEAYAAGSAIAQPAARLLNRAGDKMVDLTVEPVSGGAEALRQIVLPLSSIAAGDYVIEVSAKDGDAQAKELIGFRLVG